LSSGAAPTFGAQPPPETGPVVLRGGCVRKPSGSLRCPGPVPMVQARRWRRQPIYGVDDILPPEADGPTPPQWLCKTGRISRGLACFCWGPPPQLQAVDLDPTFCYLQ